MLCIGDPVGHKVEVNKWDQKDKYQLIILFPYPYPYESGQSVLVVCDENFNFAWTRTWSEMNSSSRFDRVL